MYGKDQKDSRTTMPKKTRIVLHSFYEVFLSFSLFEVVFCNGCRLVFSHWIENELRNVHTH